MNVAFGLEVGAWMIIWGLIFRLAELLFAGSGLSTALGFVH